ncbi:unnamed protein product [Symbiodinium pilosum]|uniref:Uncharacterized protein n=1 Tax=Symbiodinium pilosum TaxID=2952 RepID=A0A812QRF3_SYMPI|nr:unnamed protein product [Symbiodinium pilosum]
MRWSTWTRDSSLRLQAFKEAYPAINDRISIAEAWVFSIPTMAETIAANPPAKGTWWVLGHQPTSDMQRDRSHTPPHDNDIFEAPLQIEPPQMTQPDLDTSEDALWDNMEAEAEKLDNTTDRGKTTNERRFDN